MSSRALRRKQQLQQQKEEEEEILDESEPELITRQKFSAFSLLDDDTQSEYESSSEESKESEAAPIAVLKQSCNKKKGNKKVLEEEEEEDDDIEFPSDTEIPSSEREAEGICNPFEIDLNYLDPEVELREKMTGKKPPARNKKVKLTLAGPQTKTKLASHGLHELGFSFTSTSSSLPSIMHCNEEYEVTRGLLVHSVQSGDVEAIMQLLRDHPCHLDTLLVVSDILKHHSTTEASLLVNKAILLIHKTLNLLTLPSLSYEEEKNRCVHLALFRRVQFLLKQGCWKTALQVCKALYFLDKSDPLQVELILQFLALQASDDTILEYFVMGENISPGWRLTRLCKEDFNLTELSDFIEEFPEAYYALTNTTCDSEKERMYYKNYFALYMLYSGPLWKKRPEIKSLKKPLITVRVEDELSDALLGMYRHQALVASDHSSLRLGFPVKLLSQPILLINPFPPLDESLYEPPVSLLGRARSLITFLIP